MTIVLPYMIDSSALHKNVLLMCLSPLCTVEPVFKDHPIHHTNVVCQDRWSLVTGSVMLKCRSFCQICVVFQDRWSLMAVVSQDRFHCIHALDIMF